MAVDADSMRLLQGKVVANLCLNVSAYHLARYGELGRQLANVGGAFHVVELASSGLDWPWILSKGAAPFQWHTLVSDRPVEKVAPREQAALLLPTLERIQPEALIVPGWSHEFLRAAIKWARGRGRVCVVQGDSPRNLLDADTEQIIPRRWYVEWMKRWILRGIDGAQAAGATSARYFEDLGIPADRIVLKCDVVDNDYYAGEADRIRLNEDRERAELGLPARYFVYPSRMIRRKNHHRLLDAYARYAARAGADAWGLVLVGGGPEATRISDQVSRLGLTRVIIQAFAPAEVVAKYYALASALIFPSWGETWGLIVNEAAAAGLPLLLSNEVLAKEHLLRPGENGWDFDYDDVDAICDSMIRCAAMSSETRAAFGRASRAIVADWGLEAHAAELFRALSSGFRRRGV